VTYWAELYEGRDPVTSEALAITPALQMSLQDQEESEYSSFRLACLDLEDHCGLFQDQRRSHFNDSFPEETSPSYDHRSRACIWLDAGCWTGRQDDDAIEAGLKPGKI
jgi:hypothetical protein